MAIEEFVLDLHTGFIRGVTEYMKNDIEGSERLRGRFIPWNAPIPPGGKIDLTEWQRGKAAEIASFQQAVAPAATAPIEDPEDEEAPSGAPLISGEISAPTAPVLDAGQRFDKIMGAIPMLKAENFTKSANPMPSVKALSELCGFDVEGPEREQVFTAFKAKNTGWQIPQV